MHVRKYGASLTTGDFISSSAVLPSVPSSPGPHNCLQDHVLVEQEKIILLLRLQVYVCVYVHVPTLTHSHTCVLIHK